MDVVVVEDRIRQPVEIVEGPQRLCQFLVQAIADLLRGSVVRDEDRRDVAVGKGRPVQLAPGARGGTRPMTRHAGATKQAARGTSRCMTLRGRNSTVICAGAAAGRRDVDPGLVAQAGEEPAEILCRRRRRCAGHADADRFLEPGEDRQRPAAFEREGEIHEIARHLGVRPLRRAGGAGGNRRIGGKSGHRRDGGVPSRSAVRRRSPTGRVR